MNDAGAAAQTGEDGASEGSLLRTIRVYLLARFCTQSVTTMQAVAVGWYVYSITNSPLDLGLIGLAQFLPTAGLALIAGHVIDRFPRRSVVLVAQAVELFCGISLALMAFFGSTHVELVFAIIAGFGACRAFEQPAFVTILPALVPAAIFPRAATWSSMANQSGTIFGPLAGGTLFLLGPWVPFAALSVLLITSFISLASLTVPRSTRVGQPLSWKSLTSGIHFIWNNGAVCGSITLDLFCVLFGGATALLPIFARDILMVGSLGLGLLRAAPALGALSAGFILTRFPMRQKVGRRMLVAAAIYGAATLVFGLSHSVVLSVVALTILGAADMQSVVIRNTLMQTAPPDAIRGRVNAVNTIFLGASNQLGEFESGVTAAWFGPVGSVVLGGIATIGVCALCAWRFPSLRRMNNFAMAGENQG